MQAKSQASLTDQDPDNATGSKPAGKTYTPEEQAAVLRSLRKASIITFLVTLLIAVVGIGIVFVKTQNLAITGIATAAIAVILGYREYETYKIGRK